jgi:metal-responsive CopG/Arc/MetJ family transcriptional regulator
MKTTLNIPDSRLDALLEAANAKTRTEAVNMAIEEFIRRKKLKTLMALAGTVDDFISHEELEAARKAH